MHMLQLLPDPDQRSECWVCTDQIQAVRGLECRGWDGGGGHTALEVSSADMTAFQGLEMEFSSQPQVDDNAED